MRMNSLKLITMSLIILGGWTVGASRLHAKGLDKLSENNPENDEEAADAEKPAEDAAAAATPMVQSDSSKAIAGKLWIATSYGWVIPSRSEGDWKGSGMSDLSIGYKILPMSATMSVDGTYRYAPVAVSGDVDGHSYRGVWETHYFGGRFNYGLSSTLTAVGTAELGYVLVYLTPTDNLELDAKHEGNGAALALGGGVDWQLFEKGAALGPRLNVAFGSVSTIQVSGAVTFLF